MSKMKYTVKKELEGINYVLEGHSCNFASHIFDIGVSTIRKWGMCCIIGLSAGWTRAC